MNGKQIPIDQLIETIVRTVMAELTKQGAEIVPAGVHAAPRPPQHPGGPALEIDMSGYRTPVLTEMHLSRLGPRVGTILVPCNTVVTPGAWSAIRSKRLKLVRKAQSNA